MVTRIRNFLSKKQADAPFFLSLEMQMPYEFRQPQEAKKNTVIT